MITTDNRNTADNGNDCSSCSLFSIQFNFVYLSVFHSLYSTLHEASVKRSHCYLVFRYSSGGSFIFYSAFTSRDLSISLGFVATQSNLHRLHVIFGIQHCWDLTTREWRDHFRVHELYAPLTHWLWAGPWAVPCIISRHKRGSQSAFLWFREIQFTDWFFVIVFITTTNFFPVLLINKRIKHPSAIDQITDSVLDTIEKESQINTARHSSPRQRVATVI